MTKDNIAIAALLQTREACWEANAQPDASQVAQPILVCSAHIHWDPEFCDVKLIQTMMLMEQIRQITESFRGIHFRPGAGKKDSPKVQLLLCADFNSLPESGVIEFIKNGKVAVNHPEFKTSETVAFKVLLSVCNFAFLLGERAISDIGYKDCLFKMLSHSNNDQHFTHTFELCSAYIEELLPFTNYTFDFKGIIDYIFYPKGNMKPLGILGPVSEEWMKESKVVGCPHPHIPSDHFPLLVEFGLTLPVTSRSSAMSSQVMMGPPPSTMGYNIRRMKEF